MKKSGISTKSIGKRHSEKKAAPPAPQPIATKKKKSGQKWAKIILAGALIFTSLLLMAGLKSQISSRLTLHHTLKSIDFSNDGPITRSFVIKELGLVRNQELGSIDVRKIRQRLLKISQIREARVERVYPHQLRIHLQERVPLLRIYSESQRKYFYIAADGSVFDYILLPNLDLNTLPTLEGIAIEEGNLPLSLSLGAEVCQFYRRAQQCQPEIVSHWRTISVDQDAYELNHQLDTLTIRMSCIRNLLLRTTDIPQQMEKLTYILAESRAKHLLPLAKVDLTIEGHAYIKPLRSH